MPFAVEEVAQDKTMDDDYSSSLTVIDVFDIASEIGKEFEKIIDLYGPDAVTSIMPKVIIALEHLECLASQNERENTKLTELSDHISKLEHEKMERVQDRLRFEKEVEEIEESWKEETKQLVEMVNRLQKENKKLSQLLEANKDTSPLSSLLSPEIDIAVLQKLRGQVDTLREQMRAKETELSYKTSDVENLKRQVDRLTGTVRDLRRKHRVNQLQVRGLIDERADFLATLADHAREVAGLKQQLGLAEKENEDLYITQSEMPDLRNKAVYDLDDPSRPRFTTAELKEILHERNHLKTRLNDLEEELDAVRPPGRKRTSPPESSTGEKTLQDEEEDSQSESPDPALDAGPPSPSSPQLFVQRMAAYFPRLSSPSPGQTPLPVTAAAAVPEGEDTSVEEDRPVQGPLPCEPDDAPWKKSESGVRKFFRKLFSETSSVPFLPSSSGAKQSPISKLRLPLPLAPPQ